jgi:hypothetical protein
MVDGAPLAVAHNTDRLSAWWPMEIGEHRFWVEGETVRGADALRSEIAIIRVSEFVKDPITFSGP